MGEKKTYHEYRSGNVNSITSLIPASTSTDWWQTYYGQSDIFCFIDHRLEFEGMKDDRATFANVICVFGRENLPQEYFHRLNDLGLVLTLEEDDRSLFDY